MEKAKLGQEFSDQKISETFLRFAKPLIECYGVVPTKEQLESALNIAFLIWNAVVFDAADGNSRHENELRQHITATLPTLERDRKIVEQMVELMITRKKTTFGKDVRLIGDFRIIKKNGEWRLWAEARKAEFIQ